MAATKRRYSKDASTRRWGALVESKVLPNRAAVDENGIVAIDIVTGESELVKNEFRRTASAVSVE